MFILSEDKKWYRVSLRLMGDALPVEEIETRLNLVASTVGQKDKYIRDNPSKGKYQTNIWCSRYVTNSDVPFEEQITALLDQLEPKNHELQKLLMLPEITGELFLGFGSGNGQGGAIFSPELLNRIAKLNLSLGLDLYPPSIDTDDI